MALHVAAGLLLCLGVAQAESGVQGLVRWLETNGPELVHTPGHCAKAVSLADWLSKECETTNFDPEGMAGLAAWAIMEGFEHMQAPLARDFVNSSLAKFYKGSAIKMVQSWTHRSLQEFCGRSDCIWRLEDFDTSYRKCYSSAICDVVLAKEIPYDHCYQTMEMFMYQQMYINLPMICMKSSADSFCAEERNSLLLQNPECYMRFVIPVINEKTCSSECVSQWAQAQSISPVCTSRFEYHTQKLATMTLEFMRDLISGAKDPEMRELTEHIPKHLMTFQQACMGPATTVPPSLLV